GKDNIQMMAFDRLIVRKFRNPQVRIGKIGLDFNRPLELLDGGGSIFSPQIIMPVFKEHHGTPLDLAPMREPHWRTRSLRANTCLSFFQTFVGFLNEVLAIGATINGAYSVERHGAVAFWTGLGHGSSSALWGRLIGE